MESSSTANKISSRQPRKARSVCVPFVDEALYRRCLEEPAFYRSYLERQYAGHPELFPGAWSGGFHFHGEVVSRKQGLRQRRVRLKATGAVYQLRPSFMMPYMIGRTQTLEKPLYLRRWGVSFEGLAYVFGRPPMYWYRAYVSLGRHSVVGTTIKAAEQLPAHLIADEKHSRCQGKKVFVTTTVAHECILGAHVVESADADHLEAGYQVFRDEAHALQADYAPQSVNTDKWEATRQAWRRLFPTITLILCFLHAVLKIKNRCRTDPALWTQVGHRVWNAYAAPTLRPFAQRLRRLRQWMQTQTMLIPVKEQLHALLAQAPAFKAAYPFKGAFRTSNMLERRMNYQDRLLYAMHYFHGTLTSASLAVRAMALLWNFHPYDRHTQKKYGSEGAALSAFARLNAKTYHPNWLENMMIAASLQRKWPPHKIR